MKAKFVTTGNRKLAKFHGISFDLPPKASCPKAKVCAKICYANKISKLYPEYGKKINRNFVLAKGNRKEFIDQISQEIAFFNKGYVRIHGSGDFFSQAYLNTWAKIISSFPKVKFYAYTKSLHLSFPKLKNLVIIKSYGGKLDHLITDKDYQALMIPRHGTPPKGYVSGDIDDLWWTKNKKCSLRLH